jgi:hypothetical protein
MMMAHEWEALGVDVARRGSFGEGQGGGGGGGENEIQIIFGVEGKITVSEFV